MKAFPGFTSKETFTAVPDSFFNNLLREIEEADELKVTLYALWRFEHMEGKTRSLQEQDFTAVVENPALVLEKAVARGSLLRVRKKQAFYFLNSPRGRAMAEAFSKSSRETPSGAGRSGPPPARPNIYRLYEENIAPLTPLLADILRDAEQTYTADWVAEALEIAVRRNKRNWAYAEAILRRWKEEGHVQEQDRRDTQGLRGRDVSRKVEEFIKH